MTKEEIGILLREHRLEKGLSQETLAQLLHIDRSQISRWENGKFEISEEFWPLLKINIGIDIEEEWKKRDLDVVKVTEMNKTDKNQKTDIQILAFAMIEFLGYIIGPWGVHRLSVWNVLCI